jgi:glycosyltransferase involved in cell wall biosynthesis
LTEIIFYIFLLSFLVQAFYLLFVFPRLIFFKEPLLPDSGHPVSVVVCAHNGKNNLEKLIPILLKQDYKDFEVLLVDDRSDDGTGDLVKSFSSEKVRYVRINATPEGWDSKKYALTKGIEAAKNDVLLLTDADCRPLSNQWVREMQGGVTENKKIILGYSPYEKKQGFLNLFIRYETFYTALQYLSFALMGKAYMGVGRNLLYSKKLFLENNGFVSFKHITGGDDDLLTGKMSNKNNTSVRINSLSQVISIPKENYKRFFKQKKRHLSVGKHYSLKNKVKTGVLVLSGISLYFSFIILIFLNANISIVLEVFILRTMLLIITFALVSRKLGEPIKWLWFPVLDLSYTLNYLIIGISAIFSKNTRWI